MKIIKCDRCKTFSENPEEEGFCKILVCKGLKWQRTGRGNSYKHFHLCKKCKQEIFKK